MSTFATNASNDIIVHNGSMVMLRGHEAALALAKHYAQTLRGEMIHAMTDGVRFFETAYDTPRLALFAHDMRKRIMQVEGVLSVQRFDARLTEGELIYSADILTIWGAGTIGSTPDGAFAPRLEGLGRCRSAIFGFYINDEGDLIFYHDAKGGKEPRMYIDDDGYLMVGGER